MLFKPQKAAPKTDGFEKKLVQSLWNLSQKHSKVLDGVAWLIKINTLNLVSKNQNLSLSKSTRSEQQV